MSKAVRSHVLCAGVPSHATDLGALIVAEVLHRSGRDRIATFYANSAHDSLVNALQHDAQVAVVVADRPTNDVVDAYAEAEVPTVVIVHDLLEWLAVRMAPVEASGFGMDVLPAVRTMQVEAAPLMDILAASSALKVDQREFDRDLAAAITKISTHLGVEPAEAIAKDILSDPSHPVYAHQRSMRAAAMAPDALPDFARRFASAYQNAFEGGDTMRISFGSSFLYQGPDVTEVRDGVLDLTGRGGVVTFGPYAHLPRGLWRARYVFAIAQNAAMMPLRFAITAIDPPNTRELASLQYTPTEAGEHVVDLMFRIDSPASAIEMVVVKEQAVFEGDFAIGEVSFEKSSGTIRRMGKLYETLQVSVRERTDDGGVNLDMPATDDVLRLQNHFSA